MSNQTKKMRNALTRGLRKGLSSYIWLLKILLPISLATTFLDNSGWLHRLDFLLEPAMSALSLPPVAALPILIGLTAGIYACLATIAVLPLSAEHMTLIAVFVLIAHSLPQEGIIQSKSGINFVKTTLVRLAAAVLTCLAVAWWLQPAPTDAAVLVSAGMPEIDPLFGLGYGGAVIVEQSRELSLSPEEVEKLQLSIGINHSLIEDPLLFMPFVVSPLYAWLPRLAAAMVAVYLVSLWFKFKKKPGIEA